MKKGEDNRIILQPALTKKYDQQHVQARRAEKFYEENVYRHVIPYKAIMDLNSLGREQQEFEHSLRYHD